MRTSAAQLLLLTVLAACASETVTNPTPESTLQQTTSKTVASQTLKGNCETRFDPPPFPLPAVHRQTDTGTCTLSHLGAATIYSVQDINFATGSQVSVELWFTAANGDVLLASNVGTSVANGPTVQFQGTMTFVGGTGRFANATGEARVAGSADLLNHTAQLKFVDGWLAYSASDRSK